MDDNGSGIRLTIGQNKSDDYFFTIDENKSNWWKSDFKLRIISLSDFIVNVLDLSDNILSFDYFIGLVREDYREMVGKSPLVGGHVSYNEVIFPLMLSMGTVWLKSSNHEEIEDSLWHGTFDIQQATPSFEDKLYKENLIKNMPVGYTRFKVFFNSKGDVTNYLLAEVNSASSAFYGKSGDECGKLGTEVHNAKLFAKNKKFLKDVFNQKHYIENCLRTPSGKYCRRIAFVWGSDNVVEFHEDISDTIKANEIAQKSNKLFKDIFDNLPLGVAIFAKDGYITDMNNSFMEIYGLHSKEDMKDYNFLHDTNAVDKVKSTAYSDNCQVFFVNYDFDQIDNYQTYRHGTARINYNILHRYESKVDIGYMMICMEDTDRLMALNKVRDFENFFSLISDFAKIGYAKINLIDYTGYAIRQWYKNLCVEDDTPFINAFSQLHPDDKEKMKLFCEKTIRGEIKSFSCEMRVHAPGSANEWNWIYHSGLLVDYSIERGVVEVVGITYDITEFKESQRVLTEARNRAEEMNRMKSTFVANMSHEIRTPLNAILGFSDLLAATNDIDKRNEYLKILNNNGDLLLKLVSDILDLSKIESGTMEFFYEYTDINLLCKGLVDSLQLKTKSGVLLIFNPCQVECWLHTDITRFSQVVSNLINNAIKFTQKGTITLEYEWIDKEHIRFSVTYTGIGIDENNRKKIFDRFVKLNSFVQGTGLGLSICQSIVEQMGGSIGVDSTLGKGSRFWFILPFRPLLSD